VNSRKIFSLSSTPILNIKRETFDHLHTTTATTTTSTPIPAETDDDDDGADKLAKEAARVEMNSQQGVRRKERKGDRREA